MEANCEFSIGFAIDGRVRDAILITQEDAWVGAIEIDGSTRDGAEVTELTKRVDLSEWPDGTRLIVRRERPHPGAQLSIFDNSEGFRHTGFITNTKGDDIESLELAHRGHARVEDRVRNWKDCGLSNLPFEDYVRNQAWVAVSLVAGALISWSQMICFTGALKVAEPKKMRYRIFHVAAVLVRRGRKLVLRLDETWPWASEIVSAFAKLRSAIP